MVPPGGPARAPQGGPEVAAWSRRGESSPCSPGWPRGPRTHHLVATSPQLVVIHPARLGVRLPSGRVPSALCSFGLPPGRRRRRRRAPSAASSSAAAVARRGRFTSCRSLGCRRDLRVARRSAPQLRGAARATEHARAGRACSVAPPPSFHPRPGCEGVPRWEEMEKVRQVPGSPLGRQPVGSGRWQKEEKKKKERKKRQSSHLIGVFGEGRFHCGTSQCTVTAETNERSGEPFLEHMRTDRPFDSPKPKTSQRSIFRAVLKRSFKSLMR